MLKNPKDRILMAVVLLLAIIGLVTSLNSNESESIPILAENMTEDERAEIDTAVLNEELADFDITRISINYSGDVINVYINKETSEQYVDEYANDIANAVRTALEIRKYDMTLEKDNYSVIIYGTDGMIKLASTN